MDNARVTGGRGAAQPDEYVTPAALSALRGGGSPPTVIDVRDAEEYAAGHISGALHIPADQLVGHAANA